MAIYQTPLVTSLLAKTFQAPWSILAILTYITSSDVNIYLCFQAFAHTHLRNSRMKNVKIYKVSRQSKASRNKLEIIHLPSHLNKPLQEFWGSLISGTLCQTICILDNVLRTTNSHNAFETIWHVRGLKITYNNPI